MGTNWPASPVSDLALLELSQPVFARLMPLGRFSREGDALRQVGWGLTEWPPVTGPPTLPILLQERDTVRLAAASCADPDAIFGVGDICVGGAVCYGDSGSPALAQQHIAGTVRWTQVGIASREAVAGVCGVGVFTDATYRPFVVWVYQTILTRQILPCTCPPSTLSHEQVRHRVDRLKLKGFQPIGR